MTQVSIKIDDAAGQAVFARTIARLEDLTPMLSDVGEMLTREIDQQFRTETSLETGQKWAPLAASTLKQKQKQKKILKIWQRTGVTRATLVYQASSTKLVVGVNTYYAKFVNFGTRRMVARSLIPSVLPPRIIGEIQAIAADFLAEQ
jgi:phage gpG-like protein